MPRVFSPKSASLAFAILGILVGFTPLLIEHFRGMWARPEYQYFPFAMAAIVFLLWERGRDVVGVYTLDDKWRMRSVALIGVSLGMLLFAIYFHSPWVAAAAAILLAAIGLQLLFGGRVVNQWGIWALLWLLIRPPLRLDKDLATGLQSLSSRLSSGLLDLMGIDHLMSANVLQIPGREFFVDEACSGVVSVMSVITCGAIWAVWKNRSLFHAVVLIASGVIWALALNVTRICIIAAAEAWFQRDWSHGASHEILGLVLFLGTFVALVSTDQLLCFALAPIRLDRFWVEQAGHNWMVDAWNGFVAWMTPAIVTPAGIAVSDTGGPFHETAVSPAHSPPAIQQGRPAGSGREHPPAQSVLWVLGGAFLLLGLWQLPALFADASWQPAIRLANSLDRSSLPEQIGDWQLQEFREATRDRLRGAAGQSKIYEYRLGETGPLAILSLDFPFVDRWHRLEDCYCSSGWTQTAMEIKLLGDPIQESSDAQLGPRNLPGIVQCSFERPDGAHGYLQFGLFDQEGHWAVPPQGPPIWSRLNLDGALSPDTCLFQFQVFVADSQPSEAATQTAINQLFDVASGQLRQKMASK